jgi:Ca-activated chloride channel family protein
MKDENMKPLKIKPLKISVVAIAVALTFACAGPRESKQPTAQNTETSHAKKDATDGVAAEHASTEYFEASRARMADTSQVKASKLSHNISLPRPTNQNSQETYQDIDESGVKVVTVEPVSTFSIDVDTGSYTNTRRMLTQGMLPPSDAVRVEEFLNYFDYQYPVPNNIDTPFSVSTAISTAPWDAQRHLLSIGLKGYQPEIALNSGSNLVFLLDVSGSMNQANKLPLLKRSLAMLTGQLGDKDKVSIVVYAGASGVVLEPTSGNDTVAIERALSELQAGGSTNGAAGIEQAYQMAEQAFIKGGINRVILATDGDFNIGMVNHDALIELISKKKEKGIALTTLGFGQGNYNDYLMEQLADAGNGNYAYIDNINEARKVLVDEMQATMQIIAKDVKIQVEFNPAIVAEYRLIGYDNRALANEDFNNDKVDAGDIGAGHSVTALYEVTLKDSQSKYNDSLRYAQASQQKGANDATANMVNTDEIAHVKLRYKQPSAQQSQLLQHVVKREDIRDFVQQSDDFKFAIAVASFAQKLKNSKFSTELNYQWIADTAQQAKGDDTFGYRSEFIQLVNNASALSSINGGISQTFNRKSIEPSE